MSKLYVWVHSMIAPIHKGIQASHVQREMVETYLFQDPDTQVECKEELVSWIRQGKTLVLLEGGSCGDLAGFYDFLCDMPKDDKYPFSGWREENLDEIWTAVGIVLDSDWDKANRSSFLNDPGANEWEKTLLNRLITSREAA